MMYKLFVCLLCLATLVGAPLANPEPANPRVALDTNHGTIVVELFPDKAPATVNNFLSYLNKGFYDGTVFHRVIKGFMIQGGGFTPDMQSKPTQAPIENEADNGLKNKRGTIAMARTSQPDSATSQFFINTVNNHFLDYRDKTPSGWGYCVFGKVVDGMKTVDAIEALPTGNKGMHRDVPTEPAIITKAVLIRPTVKPESKH